MKQDVISFEILADGTISFITDAVSGTNHASADELLKQMTTTMGGSRETKKRSRLGAMHGHSHGGHYHVH